MTDEIVEVSSTGQEGEQTQQDVNQTDQSTVETGDEQRADQQVEQNQEGKDTPDWAIKRIGKLTARNHEAERQVQAAKGEAERYRLLLEQVRQGSDVEQQQAKPGDQPDIEQLVERRAQEKADNQVMQERGRSVATTGAEKFPDFQQAVTTLDAIGITQEQVQNLLSMDDAHQVIYTLGKNPEEASRILALPPLQQGRELERMAAKASQAPAPKAVSSAPAPVKPIDGTSSGEKDPSKMTTDEWMKWREKTTTTRY